MSALIASSLRVGLNLNALVLLLEDDCPVLSLFMGSTFFSIVVAKALGLAMDYYAHDLFLVYRFSGKVLFA